MISVRRETRLDGFLMMFWITRVHHHRQTSGENESSSSLWFFSLPLSANFLLYSLTNRETWGQQSVYKYFRFSLVFPCACSTRAPSLFYSYLLILSWPGLSSFTKQLSCCLFILIVWSQTRWFWIDSLHILNWYCSCLVYEQKFLKYW